MPRKDASSLTSMSRCTDGCRLAGLVGPDSSLAIEGWKPGSTSHTHTSGGGSSRRGEGEGDLDTERRLPRMLDSPVMPFRALRPLRVDACENEPLRPKSPLTSMMWTRNEGTSVLPDMVLPRPRSILPEWVGTYLFSPRYAAHGFSGIRSGSGTG